MRENRIDHSRRNFLRGGLKPVQLEKKHARPRMPWADPERFYSACTRCGDCVDKCPEGIIIIGDGGFPEVSAKRGECTFCGTCRDVCPEPAFDNTLPQPWPFKALVAENCLAHSGTNCQSCRDACGFSAIRFQPRLGGEALPEVDTDQCNGCGACVQPCPVSAITMGEPVSQDIEPRQTGAAIGKAAHV